MAIDCKFWIGAEKKWRKEKNSRDSKLLRKF
jgi:hypothetical protein